MLAPVTEALIRDGGTSEGQSVLDIAAGAGEPSLKFAARVRPRGSVTCTRRGCGNGLTPLARKQTTVN